jgi:hypothetical protein
MRDIAETIGRGLQVSVISISAEEAPEYFGWWGMFAGADLLASSATTRKKLGWNPTGPALIADLEQMDHSQVKALVTSHRQVAKRAFSLLRRIKLH